MATLRLYLPPNDPTKKVPVLRMINEEEKSVDRRARNLLRQLRKIPGLTGTVVDDVSYGGGGALPMAEIPTSVLHIEMTGMSGGELARRLRETDPPVIVRVKKDLLVVDPRTVLPEDISDLIRAFHQIAG